MANPSGTHLEHHNQDATATNSNGPSSSFNGNGINPANGKPESSNSGAALKHNPGISNDWTAEEQSILEDGLSKRRSSAREGRRTIYQEKARIKRKNLLILQQSHLPSLLALMLLRMQIQWFPSTMMMESLVKILAESLGSSLSKMHRLWVKFLLIFQQCRYRKTSTYFSVHETTSSKL
ncbi:hypothetical protein LINPERHAP2_LOCUS15308 [Linum perenne]